MESVLQRIRESGVPAVALCQDIEGMYYISVKGFGAIRRFVLHLYEEHGCRSFHFAGGPKGNYENEQRVSAFLDTLRELGVPEEAATVSYGDFGKNTGIEVVRFLTENGGKRIQCEDRAGTFGKVHSDQHRDRCLCRDRG